MKWPENRKFSDDFRGNRSESIHFNSLKVKESRYIHNLCSADLSNSFSQLIVPTFIFSQYFFSVDFEDFSVA